MVKKCEECGKEFSVRDNNKKHAKRRFCSQICAWQKRKGEKRICQQCGVAFWISAYEVERGRKFCSRDCAGLARRQRDTVSCQQCGKSITAASCKFRAGRKKFCSKMCQYAAKECKVECICIICKETFYELPSQIRFWGQAKYCSSKCQHLGQRTGIKKACIQCGRAIIVRPCELGRKKYCSRACRSRQLFSGDRNPNWAGGDTGSYPKTFNAKFKLTIRRRDNYACARCGDYGLNVHHIDFVKANTTPENCIVVCSPCHGKTLRNRPYWIEFYQKIMRSRLCALPHSQLVLPNMA